jgi:4'-phosphopantetheinyl transferase
VPLKSTEIINPQSTLYLWNITEPDHFFLEKLELSSIELGLLSKFHPRRFREFIASRYLIQKSVGLVESIDLFKDEHGKLLVNRKDSYLSLSHSQDWTGFVFSDKPVGFDIQVYTDKINTIANRFLSTVEQSMISQISPNLQLQYKTLAWCAKEAIYKCYGKKNIIFKDQIKLNVWISDSNNIFLNSGELILDELEIIKYSLFINIENTYCYAIAFPE